GNKSLKIKAASGRLGADVVVCHEYRDYRHFRSIYDQSYDNGILLPTSSGQQIINYPKLHSRNCTAKHQSTYSRFKPMVRILKNLRGRLVEQGLIAEGLAPSYFIEGLLYNAPGDKFQSSLGSSLISCINWILKSDRSKFVCPNEKYYLFGESNVQWSIANCNHFLNAVLVFWESW
ncbi:MAG TPA: nucleotidyltransferase, partial [bacterium]